MAQKIRHVVVIGAGVTGLQTAVTLLEAGFKVTIIAKHLPGDKSIEYTSPWAGADWRTFASPEDKETVSWDTESYKTWMDTVQREQYPGYTGPKSGVGALESVHYWANPDDPEIASGPQNVWYAHLVHDFTEIPSSQLPPSIHAGIKYKSIAVNVPHYLAQLRQRASSLGAVIIRSFLPITTGLPGALAAARILVASEGRTNIDAFVNATGLLARSLVPSEKEILQPIRGQTVLVRGEAHRISAIGGLKSGPLYVIPRPGSGTTILGGTREEGRWVEEPEGEATERILEGCRGLAPELVGARGEFEVVSVQVGYRPGRKGGVRVEVEEVDGEGGGKWIVCHAYGHAGAGYQNSFGSARKVARLLGEYYEKGKEREAKL